MADEFIEHVRRSPSQGSVKVAAVAVATSLTERLADDLPERVRR
jgi:hypothetical protein